MFDVSKPDECSAQQWTTGEVERKLRLFCRKLQSFLFSLCLRQFTEIDELYVERLRWGDDLHRPGFQSLHDAVRVDARDVGGGRRPRDRAEWERRAVLIEAGGGRGDRLIERDRRRRKRDVDRRQRQETVAVVQPPGVPSRSRP